MKVRAKNWIKTDSGWHGFGEVFDVESIDGLAEMVDIIECDTGDHAENHDEVAHGETSDGQKPARRSRKQK